MFRLLPIFSLQPASQSPLTGQVAASLTPDSELAAVSDPQESVGLPRANDDSEASRNVRVKLICSEKEEDKGAEMMKRLMSDLLLLLPCFLST